MSKLCNVCPRMCNINRTTNLGFCKCGDLPVISKVMLHHFEEPPISGTNGSGAIFFGSCTLKCVYCQNFDISSECKGKPVSIETLASIFKQLETAGAHNINLVTPTHFTEQIIEALKIYKPNIPIVWNTSGFERAETIECLKGYVDIFLTDLKYFSEELSAKYSLASSYFKECSKAIVQMRKNLPQDIFQDGMMKKGILIRHLCLPNHTHDSEQIIDWIYNTLGNNTYLSLMSQYTPMGKASQFTKLNRKLKPVEYKILCNKLTGLGFKNVFLQDLTSASDEFTPDFNSNETDFIF